MAADEFRYRFPPNRFVIYFFFLLIFLETIRCDDESINRKTDECCKQVFTYLIIVVTVDLDFVFVLR